MLNHHYAHSISQVHVYVCTAMLLAVGASNQRLQADGIYEIQAGTFRTIGGFAGILDFELPSSHQSFVRLETDDDTNLAIMKFLDDNMLPVDLFGIGTDFANGVLQNGVYSFFDDTLIAPHDTRGTLDYTVDANEYEDGVFMNSTWAEGDWNGDGEFSTSDLIVAFADGGFERGPRHDIVAAVPEPNGLFVPCMLAAMIFPYARRRVNWRP